MLKEGQEIASQQRIEYLLWRNVCYNVRLLNICERRLCSGWRRQNKCDNPEQE